MGLFNDGIKNIASRIDKMREEYLAMSSNFKNLETAFDKFIAHSDAKIEKLSKENEELRRRMTEMEGVMNATLKLSMKEALQCVIREHLQNDGNISQIADENPANLILQNGQ